MFSATRNSRNSGENKYILSVIDYVFAWIYLKSYKRYNHVTLNAVCNISKNTLKREREGGGGCGCEYHWTSPLAKNLNVVDFTRLKSYRQEGFWTEFNSLLFNLHFHINATAYELLAWNAYVKINYIYGNIQDLHVLQKSLFLGKQANWQQS